MSVDAVEEEIPDLLRIGKDKNPYRGKEELGKIVVNKRKTVTPYNSAKHLQRADLPVYCKDCVYRGKDVGGNGKCPKYDSAEGATCTVRKDLNEFHEKIDTRNGEALKDVIGEEIKQSLNRLRMAEFQAAMEGGFLDKQSNAELNSLMRLVKLQSELLGTVKAIQVKQEQGEKGIITQILEGKFNLDQIAGGDNGETA